MPTAFQALSMLLILAVTVAGGWLPLFRTGQARRAEGFPLGQAFSAGIFLALALVMMLPSAMNLLSGALPDLDFPLAAALAGCAFMGLVALEHGADHLSRLARQGSGRSPWQVPVIMTVMIALPSFFLGAALAISPTRQAVAILVAILLHKGSAAFALALNMVRSTLSRGQAVALFALFACSTPAGIVLGDELQGALGRESLMLAKGVVLSLASGTFLFMSTLHELRESPLIAQCGLRGFGVGLAGFVLTLLVRLVLGEAHHF
jgi:zinc transporter ZupT